MEGAGRPRQTGPHSRRWHDGETLRITESENPSGEKLCCSQMCYADYHTSSQELKCSQLPKVVSVKTFRNGVWIVSTDTFLGKSSLNRNRQTIQQVYKRKFFIQTFDNFQEVLLETPLIFGLIIVGNVEPVFGLSAANAKMWKIVKFCCEGSRKRWFYLFVCQYFYITYNFLEMILVDEILLKVYSCSTHEDKILTTNNWWNKLK